MMSFLVKLTLAATVAAELTADQDDHLVLLQMRAMKSSESTEALEDDDQRPENMCRDGIKVRNICYARSCGRTGQQPGGRNCASLPGGANACCMSRIQRTCTGPNMDRCRCVNPGMGMGKMGMGKMGKMGMGKMGKMGKMGMGMGDDDDEAEAVGDPHLTTSTGEKEDLCCDGGECHACPPAMLQEEDKMAAVEEDTLASDKSEEASEESLVAEDDQRPENMCRSGIKVLNICYANSCGRTGQRPGGRNCGSLPGGANACCMSRITRTCTGPNMDRCRLPAGKMGMGKMGKMGMGKMGKMGMGKMGKMGMGGDIDDEAEAVGDPHLTLANGMKEDLCCEGGVCKACEQ